VTDIQTVVLWNVVCVDRSLDVPGVPGCYVWQ
jgi:hypothetical protein